MSTKYEVIKGAESEIEFHGLYGKYVWGLLIGLGVTLLLGLVLFILLPSPTLALIIVAGAAAAVIYLTFYGNKKYGRWGLEQEMIKRRLPAHVVVQRPTTLIRTPHAKA